MSSEDKPSSFISKFRTILQSEKFHDIIKLDEEKGKIYIFNKEKLEDQILNDFFRHKKLSSFVRQLNLYGFKKIKNISTMCFTHPSLLKGQRLQSIISQKKLKRNQEELEQLSETPINGPLNSDQRQLPFERINITHTNQPINFSRNSNGNSHFLSTLAFPQVVPTGIPAPMGWGIVPSPMMMPVIVPLPQMYQGFPFMNYPSYNHS